MASKPPTISPESIGAAALAQYPPSISLSNKLLSSALVLPEDPAFAYAVYSPPAPSPLHVDAIELARRKVFASQKPSILESTLCSVRVEKDVNHLYVFAVASASTIEESRAALSTMHLEGLSCTFSSTFSPRQIYPCSPSCSTQCSICPTCLIPAIFPQVITYPADPIYHTASFIPREPLRIPNAQFIQAIRDRLTDDICNTSGNDSRRLYRLRDGFLIFPQSSLSDWGSGWDHHAQNRPPIHTYLHLTLSANRILIQPLLRPTHYLPLLPNQPLPAGTPVVLLPHGTPAYYLAAYTGPTSALNAQFSQSLVGLGCPPPRAHELAYLIVWIGVQNKNGEAKGVTAIWPACLVLSYLPSSMSPHAWTPLSPLPDLPLQLQPSPPPPAAPTPVSLTAVTQSIVSTGVTDSQPTLPPALTRRAHAHIAPGPAALRVLRTLCLSSDAPSCADVRSVAAEVGGYVDAVAKERERERERLKRERESMAAGTSGPPPIRGTISVVTSGNTPGSAGMQSPLAGSLFGSAGSPAVASGPPSATSPSAISSIPNVTVGETQGQPAPQPFYPSPPSGSAGMQASSTPGKPPPTAVPLTMHFQTASNPPADLPTIVPGRQNTFTVPVEQGFESFGSFDDWAQSSAPWQPSSDFINIMALDDVPIGADIGMDMNIGANASFTVDPVSGGAGWGSGDMSRMDIDSTGMDDIFTDADFDFWDSKPPPSTSVTARPLEMGTSMSVGTGLTPTAGPAPLGIPSPLYADPVQVAVTPAESPWGVAGLADGFVPRGDALVLAPDLLPPSPTKTASSQSVPSTPHATVHVVPEAEVHLNLPLAPGSRNFGPIPFASVHRVADGKYTAGKFALPSPPDEEDRTQPIPLLSTQRGAPSIWTKYTAATDPRIGVVRKLIGVKRKSLLQGGRDSKVTPPSSWARASDEWARDVVQMPPLDEEEQSDGDSYDEEDDDDAWAEDEAPSPDGVRPSTPAPSYLPLGPTLLHTYFKHAHLLPLSTPLKPPDSAVSPPNIAVGAAPISVPTPVSPAALLGAASEKSKSLEAAAHILAKEVVESAVWNDAWRANAGEYSSECRSVTEVWQADVKRVVQAFEALPGIEAPFDLNTAFEAVHPITKEVVPPTLELLESPMMNVGKSDAIIQVLPTALRFWGKLGLTPRAGKKDVVAFVFFEELDEERQNEAEKWLQCVSDTYTSNNLGAHTAGRSSSCSRDGLVPLRFDSFRKTLASFVASLPSTSANYVFYIAAPSSTITLSSPTLRQVFSAVKRAQKTYSEAQILFQFLPAHLIHSHKYASADRWGMIPFACSVYDRILRPVNRVMSRRFFEHGERIHNFFQEPAFSLARPVHNKAHLVRQHPVLTLDVMERHTLLHVGYRISACGRWLLASCVDQRGEAHDLGVWIAPSETPDASTIQQLWLFALTFAKKASVEWRIVFAKLGSMGTNELDAWIRFLDRLAPSCRELPMCQVTLLAVETDASWTFLAPPNQGKRSPSPARPSKPSSGTFLADISSSTYCLTHDPSANLLSPCDLVSNIEPCYAYVADPSELPGAHCNLDHMRPKRTATLVRVPCTTDYTAIAMLHVHHLHAVRSPRSTNTLSEAQTLHDVAQNYHELAVLAQARGLKANPILPFHLGALEVMDGALSGSLTSDL